MEPPKGLLSLEESIVHADVVVRAEFVRVEGTTMPFSAPGKSGHYPVLEMTFRVLEYLKGSGASEIVAVVVDVVEVYATEAEALAAVPAALSERDDRWDSREALIFLEDGWHDMPAIRQEGHYFLGALAYYDSDGRSDGLYTISSRYGKWWLPEARDGQSGVRQPANVNDKKFLLDVPGTLATTRNTDSAPASEADTAPTITVASLRSKITALEAEVATGDGTDEYRKCVALMYRAAREARWWIAQGEAVYRWDHNVGSGLPAGTVLYKDEHGIGIAPDKVGRYWLEGNDKDIAQIAVLDITTYGEALFYRRQITTARPLPAGEYQFFGNGRPAERHYCDGFAEVERNRFQHNVTVTAPAGVAHEALYDPVVSEAVVGETDVSSRFKRIEWQSGSLTVELDSVDGLTDHHIDFLDIDGSIALSVSRADATVDQTAKTLTWSVAGQPWQAGDQLMARLYRVTSTTCASSSPFGACNRPPAFASASYAFSVSEDVAAGHSVGSVTATDPDGGTVSYSIMAGHDSGLFAIDGSGNITLAAALDYETASSHTLTIRADDDMWASRAQVTVTVLPPPPPAPSGLTTRLGTRSVTLNWQVPDDDSVTGYQILRRRPQMGEDTFLVYVKNTGSTATTFTDRVVTAGTRHVYRVKAINAAGLSEWSNAARVVPYGRASE